MAEINTIQFHELTEASSAAATDVLAIDTGNALLKLPAGKMVMGVKGNAESSYRTGNVNITPANIGAPTVAQMNTAIQQSTAVSSVQTINYGSNSYIQYCKSGSIVYIFVRFVPSDGTITKWNILTIGTLPTGYRPKFQCYLPLGTDRASSVGAILSIGTGGAVQIGARYNDINDTGDRLETTGTFLAG